MNEVDPLPRVEPKYPEKGPYQYDRRRIYVRPATDHELKRNICSRIFAKPLSNRIHHTIDTPASSFAERRYHHDVEARRRLPMSSLEHLWLQDIDRGLRVAILLENSLCRRGLAPSASEAPPRR